MKARILFIFFFILLAATGVHAQYRLYESGMKAYKAQNYDQAITDLNEFLSKWQHDRKNDDEINYALAVCYFKKEDFLNSMKMLDATARANPNFQRGSVSWLLAICCDKLNQTKEAVVEYGNAIKEYQNDGEKRSKLLTERAKIEIRIGDYQIAKDDLSSALAFDPNNHEAKVTLNKLNDDQIASRAAKAQAKSKNPDVKKPDEKKPEEKKPEEKVPDSGAALAVVAAPLTTKPEEKKPEEKKPEEKKPEEKVPDTGATSTVVAAPVTTKPEEKKPEEKKPEQKKAEEKIPDGQNAGAALAVVAAPVIVAPQQSVQQAVAENKIPTLAEMYADEKRYALVIGNSSYPPSMGLLPNPKNDASDIAAELRKQGFSVNLLIDATYGEMKKGIFDLKKTLDGSVRDKTVALFYYAGHGIQAMNENWLIPVDSKLEIHDEDDIRIQCVPVQALVLNNLLYTNSRMNIIILDACRNNPIPSVSRSAGGKGLQEVSRARGSWIAFATAPGSVASDGQGRNGLYTQELLKALSKPGLSIEDVFKEVRKNVYIQSGERQETWDNSNIIGDFYFNLNKN